MGDCYEQMERHDDSIAAFQKVIEIDNTDPEGWFGAGMIFILQNRHQEAITYILKAIEFDSSNLDYWINLGYVNEDAGMIEEALKCYAHVTRSDAADRDGWIALTGLLMKEGDFDQALNFLRAAYVHHPAEAAIKVKMAICHLKVKEPALALKFLEEGLEKDSSLLADFAYYFPEGSYSIEFKRVIQKIKS